MCLQYPKKCYKLCSARKVLKFSEIDNGRATRRRSMIFPPYASDIMYGNHV